MFTIYIEKDLSLIKKKAQKQLQHASHNVINILNQTTKRKLIFKTIL
jgi:peptidyl-tRNA hydrolase